MKVVFFTHNLGYGGAERCIVNITSELKKRGHDVEILLVDKEGGLIKDVHEDVRVRELDGEPLLRAGLDLRTFIREHSPDILVSNVNTANLMAIAAVKTIRTDTSLIVGVHNTLSVKKQDYSTGVKDRFIPYLMRVLYPLGDQFIAVSQGVADNLSSNYNVPKHRINVIYNPCVTDQIIEKGSQPTDDALSFHSNGDLILGVGSLIEQKEFSTLIRAFSDVVKKKPDSRLAIIGDGPERANLENLAMELNIADKVSILGHVDNVYSYMANADLFVLSSRWEGFGIVIVEAMAFGTPIVATDCPHGPREILEAGKYGRLSPVGDSSKLADAIIETLNSPPNSTDVQKRAYDFHVSNVADDYEKLLF